MQARWDRQTCYQEFAAEIKKGLSSIPGSLTSSKLSEGVASSLILLSGNSRPPNTTPLDAPGHRDRNLSG
ncbi:hypothetical protein MLD38_030404 [Melastoma candidum]|uniref:Uncharacterized protein n=1 Tax=Melastoma candidum TaxID=119954 RepID=A0ACB9MNG0_9MYRT|nr:hypothetical protein MLD38_030404 [Melastoma candidum]